MKTLYLPLSANKQISVRDPLYLRKLLISDITAPSVLPNPIEFSLKVFNYDIFSDFHPALLPLKEIRLPCPIINQPSCGIELMTHPGQEAELDSYNLALDCEKRLQDTGLLALPYFLVYRFHQSATLSERTISMIRIQRIPVDQLFSPLFSYGKIFYMNEVLRYWVATPFQFGDICQIEDVSNDLIAQGWLAADQYFPGPYEPAHRFNTHEGWVEECKLEAVIQNPLFDSYDGDFFFYFVIAGILSNQKEFGIFDANFQSIPIR